MLDTGGRVSLIVKRLQNAILAAQEPFQDVLNAIEEHIANACSYDYLASTRSQLYSIEPGCDGDLFGRFRCKLKQLKSPPVFVSELPSRRNSNTVGKYTILQVCLCGVPT